jgi:hypothetical protein
VTAPALRPVGAAPLDVPALVPALSRQLAGEQFEIEAADLYYNGTQPLQFLAPEVRQQVGNRLTSLVINWPRVIVDSVQRRTYVEGFRLGRGGLADDEMWRIWQANDLDEWSQLAHIDALVHGRCFLSVWGDDADPETPRIAVESAHQMTVAYVPGGRSLRAALKRWRDDEQGVEYATLLEAGQVTRWAADSGTSGASSSNPDWRFDRRLPNRLDAVPVVPMINRPRVLDLSGESELTDVIPLADAVNKLATDLMVTSEFHATKRRYATGIQIPEAGGEAGDADLRRLRAEAAAYWDQATKGKTWLAGPGVQFGQFDEATLDNFAGAIRLFTSQIAAIGGLPPDDLGLNTVNPASAEARRAAETVLINRAKEKMRSWGGTYERTMRLALAVQQGVPVRALPAELRGMETIWADPQTPSFAAQMDAAVKGVQQDIIDSEQAQEDLGYTPVQREAMAERARVKASSAATQDIEARVALAQRLADTGAFTLNAALATVGLLQAASINSSEGNTSANGQPQQATPAPVPPPAPGA